MSAFALSSEAQPVSAEGSGRHLFMSRKPIYNAKFESVGYEMRLHGGPRLLTQRNIFFFDAFTNLPAIELLGGALAFIHCELDENVPEFEEIVDPQRIVIDLAAPTDAQATGLLGENIEALHNRGFQVSVGEYVLQKEYRSLLKKVDYLKIDTRRVKPLVLQMLPQKLASIQKLKLIATHLASPDQLDVMVAAGYHSFQGTLHPEKINTQVKTIASSRQNILALLRQTQQKADIDVIEAGLKRDPGLVFHLMRYVNSAIFTAQFSKTTTLKRAVQLLGHQKLYRWLIIRLMSSSTHPAQSLLLRAALTRGRMMELLASECTPQLSSDNAFMTGVFSVMDRLLGLSLEEACAGMELDPEVRAGLAHAGALGKLLISIKACELPDEEVLLTYEEELGLKNVLAMAHLNAIHWAEKMISI